MISRIVVLAGVCIANYSVAHAYCYEPDQDPPSCTEQIIDEKFSDDFDFEMCKSDVEDYIDELEEWVSCVQNEAQERAGDATNKFNCKAQGDVLC